MWQAISSKEIKRWRKGALGSDGMMTKLAVATGQLPLLSHWRQKYVPAPNMAKRLELWLREANGENTGIIKFRQNSTAGAIFHCLRTGQRWSNGLDCGWTQTVFEVTGLRVELWVPRDGFPKRIQTREG